MNLGKFLILSCLTLVGCGNNLPEQGSEKIIKVGDNYVLQAQIDFSLSKFDYLAQQNIKTNKDQYRDLLESIALTQLMADKQYKELSEQEKSTLAIQVKAYENELLAKEYLARKAQVKQPTRADIEEYYNSHLEFFGKTNQYEIEQLKILDNCLLEPALTSVILDKKLYEKLKKSKCEILQSNELISAKDIHSKYTFASKSVDKNMAYWTSVNNQPMIVFIKDTLVTEARPVSEVTNEIRQRLAAENFKKSFEDERLKLSLEIEYLK